MLKIAKRREEVRVVLQEANGDDPAAAVVLDPITPAMRRRALRSIRPLLEGVTDTNDVDPDVMGDVGEKVSVELLRMGIREISGIADEDGNAFDLTPDQATRIRTANDPQRPTGTIDDLLADDSVFNKLDEGYVRPDALRRAEKNGLSGLPNGTSTAATPDNATASLPAKPKRKAVAKPAPTSKTRSKAKPARASGRR